MITVTNNNDSGAGSFRQALADAASGEEINFSITGTITLTSGELFIGQNQIITGPGSNLLTVDGDDLFRVFNCDTGVISISGIEVSSGGSVGSGAGIHNEATLTLDDVVVRECESTDDGGGIWNSSTITATDLTVTGCRADNGNGGGVHNTGTFTGTDVIITLCTSLQDGAGVWSDGTYTHEGGSISTNIASGVIGGGGINTTGTCDITEISVTDNLSNGNGLALYNQFGTVTIIRCCLNNTSESQLEVYNEFGTLNIDNSTVDGGGTNSLLIVNQGVFDIRHCTLTNGNYGIASQNPGAFVTIQNTIVCGNSGGVDVEVDTADLTSDGNNIFGSSTNPITPGPGDQFGVVIADVALGPLQNNGGTTLTRALLFSSVALDAGNNTGAPATDQRGTGFARVINGTIDIGAYEAQTTPEPPDPEPEPEPEPPQPSPEPVPEPDPPSPITPTSSDLTPCVAPKQDCGFLGTPGDEDNPGIANLSAEAPDVDIFSNIPHPVVWLQPPLVGTGPGRDGFGEPTYTGPQPCTAIAQGANGTSMGGQIVVVCNPIVPEPQRPVIYNQWPQPPIIPSGPQEGTEMFPNEEQTCSAACVDGGQFTITVPEGVYYAKTVALANALARSVACSAAQSRLMCVGGTLATGCADSSYSGVVTMQGAPTTRQGTTRTITWVVVSGSPPPGILLQSSGMNLLVSGIPTTGGNYEFTLRGTDPEGFSAQKFFELSIIQIVTELPDCQLDEPYSEQIFVSGGTGSNTFSLVLGALPTGLSLSQSGLLSGTPTEEGLFSFVVGVTKDGITCTKQYVLDVSEVCGEFTIDTTFIDQVYGNGVSSTTVDAEGNSVCNQTVGPNMSSGALSQWGIAIENICDHDIDVQLDYDFAINCTTPTNDFIPMDPPQAIASVTVAGYAPGLSESVVGDSGIESPGTTHSDSGTPSHTVTVGVGNTLNLTIICTCQQQSTIGGAADLSFELEITVIT